MKRIHSDLDKYKNEGPCMIEEMFENNKLEYVHVENLLKDSNIVGDMTLSQNVLNLRYMYIEQYNVKYNIAVDASTVFPNGLHVYDVKTEDNRNKQYGTIQGTPDAVTQLMLQLIHELKL